MFTDAYARLSAMKLFALRASDYQRSASLADRRYLLFNPMVKMKVTTQGEEVINLLWDVIAAKGFEKSMYFEMAARDIRALPKLEGTVHVNIALIVKFLANYFFNHESYPVIPECIQPAHDAFLFDQGPTKGLGKIRFHDYKISYGLFDTPNLAVFKEQVSLFKAMLAKATPTEAQARNTDFQLAVGELFALVVYGQLILEMASLRGVGADLVDQIFDFMVRDFSKFALQLYSKPSATPAQMELCLKMIRKPDHDEAPLRARLGGGLRPERRLRDEPVRRGGWRSPDREIKPHKWKSRPAGRLFSWLGRVSHGVPLRAGWSLFRRRCRDP